MPDGLRHLEPGHPVHAVSDELLAELRRAQDELLDPAADAARSYADALGDVTSKDAPPSATPFDGRSVGECRNMTRAELVAVMEDRDPGADPALLAEVADRMQLRWAFADPDAAIAFVEAKATAIVEDFPAAAADIEQGRNPGDVLDPFIVAATQELVYAGSPRDALGAIASHKIMMVIEGLIGHLHEDVVALMRGNVRVPEPKGEELDPLLNPFPGADVVQPPWGPDRGLVFHQVKSKTGSAKGGDAARLGAQLQLLLDTYGGRVYYDALVGRSLRGHRSKGGVLKACPEVVVLVGQAAFVELTGSRAGAELLLRVYLEAFERVARATSYSIEQVAAGIAAEFDARTEDQDGREFLEVLLDDVTTTGDPADQSSLTYRARRGGRQARLPGV